MNWALVCRPVELGGLGVRDLQRTGIALRARWIWLQRTDPDRPWAPLPIPHDPDASAIVRASTVWDVGDGRSCRFWSDHWIDGRCIADIAPLVHCLVSRRTRKNRSVHDGPTDRAWIRDISGVLGPAATLQYIELWRLLRPRLPSEASDRLIWRWTPSGMYTAMTCYSALFQGSTHDPTWRLIWKSGAPLRIKTFSWLALLDRCWTVDRLARCGLPHPVQ